MLAETHSSAGLGWEIAGVYSAQCTDRATIAAVDRLKVMTLNLAHARGDRWHQWLARPRRIERNLDRVGELLCREQPHLVALQEADGPSAWSGRFDHVAYLARAAEFPYYVRGDHVRRRIGRYGNGLLSRLPLAEPSLLRFSPSPPTPRKGLVSSRCCWPGRPDLAFDLVTLHLDFLRPAIRERQVIAHFSQRPGPKIVMGDFNCTWRGRESSLRLLARELNLTPFRPDERRLVSYPRLRRRLDWIFISPHFEFAGYHHLPDRVSDHRAVVAELRLRADG